MTDDVDYSGAKAPFINCTLKKSSPYRGRVDASAAIMFRRGVSVELIRAFGHDITTGVYPGMREHGRRSTPVRHLPAGPRQRHPGLAEERR